MTSPAPSYHGYRFPPEIISHAVWLSHRFGLSFRDAEDLLAQRGITVTYETIRQWCQTFGLDDARRLRRGRGRMGDTWHLDELFVTIQGQRQYLWRAVDQDGDVIDVLVQSRRHRGAAARFFRKLLKGPGREPHWLITDKLRSYSAAHRTVMPVDSALAGKAAIKADINRYGEGVILARTGRLSRSWVDSNGNFLLMERVGRPNANFGTSISAVRLHDRHTTRSSGRIRVPW